MGGNDTEKPWIAALKIVKQANLAGAAVADKPYDSALKALVEPEPACWPAFLGRPPGPTAVIDADIATITGAADKVLRVSAATPYLLHLEFVSGHDSARLPPKLHVRNALLEDRHDLPVLSCAVLLRPQADSPQLTGLYQRRFPDEDSPYLLFRYQVVRVWQLPPEPLLNGGLNLLPLALISAVTEADLPGIIKHIEQRLHGRDARKQAPLVWQAAYILMGLRYSSALAAQLFRGVLSMRESSTYQAILQEGREEGREKGREEGRGEGAVAEARKVLRLLGDLAFGPPDSATSAMIDGFNDLAHLEEALKRLRTAASWADLLGQPPPRRRAKRRPSS